MKNLTNLTPTQQHIVDTLSDNNDSRRKKKPRKEKGEKIKCKKP